MMFETYTIALFGNRELTNGLTIERYLENKLSELAASHAHLTVLVGRNGEFDLLASSVVHRLQAVLVVNDVFIRLYFHILPKNCLKTKNPIQPIMMISALIPKPRLRISKQRSQLEITA